MWFRQDIKGPFFVVVEVIYKRRDENDVLMIDTMFYSIRLDTVRQHDAQTALLLVPPIRGEGEQGTEMY